MNKTIPTLFPTLAALLLAALCLLWPGPATALTVSKSMPLYALSLIHI